MEPKICRGFNGEFGGLDYLGMLPKRYNSQKKIIITVDGRTTKARFYDGKKLIKEASTRCHPDDEFDFAVGARIAFNRLCKKEEKKYYDGKIVCVEARTCFFTKGKVYSVKNGELINDYGNPEAHRYSNLRDLNNHQISQFIEFVED